MEFVYTTLITICYAFPFLKISFICTFDVVIVILLLMLLGW